MVVLTCDLIMFKNQVKNLSPPKLVNLILPALWLHWNVVHLQHTCDVGTVVSSLWFCFVIIFRFHDTCTRHHCAHFFCTVQQCITHAPKGTGVPKMMAAFGTELPPMPFMVSWINKVLQMSVNTTLSSLSFKIYFKAVSISYHLYGLFQGQKTFVKG